MKVDSVGAQGGAEKVEQYDVKVAKVSQDAEKRNAEAKLRLIESAATPPPVKPGHKLSVLA